MRGIPNNEGSLLVQCLIANNTETEDPVTTVDITDTVRIDEPPVLCSDGTSRVCR